MTVQWNGNGYLFALALSLTIVFFGTGASAQGYTDIHDFSIPLLAAPQCSGMMAQGRDGNLYGTGPLGGDFGRRALARS